MAIIESTGGSLLNMDGFRRPFEKAGALAANDFAGQARIGSLATDTSAGKLYICTATNGTTTTTWTVVGAQV